MPQFWAWALEQDGEFGGLPPPSHGLALSVSHDRADLTHDPADAARSDPRANTTIAVVATNARLDKASAKRLAVMAQDGLARSIRPGAYAAGRRHGVRHRHRPARSRCRSAGAGRTRHAGCGLPRPRRGARRLQCRVTRRGARLAGRVRPLIDCQPTAAGGISVNAFSRRHLFGAAGALVTVSAFGPEAWAAGQGPARDRHVARAAGARSDQERRRRHPRGHDAQHLREPRPHRPHRRHRRRASPRAGPSRRTARNTSSSCARA